MKAHDIKGRNRIEKKNRGKEFGGGRTSKQCVPRKGREAKVCHSG